MIKIKLNKKLLFFILLPSIFLTEVALSQTAQTARRTRTKALGAAAVNRSTTSSNNSNPEHYALAASTSSAGNPMNDSNIKRMIKSNNQGLYKSPFGLPEVSNSESGDYLACIKELNRKKREIDEIINSCYLAQKYPSSLSEILSSPSNTCLSSYQTTKRPRLPGCVEKKSCDYLCAEFLSPQVVKMCNKELNTFNENWKRLVKKCTSIKEQGRNDKGNHKDQRDMDNARLKKIILKNLKFNYKKPNISSKVKENMSNSDSFKKCYDGYLKAIDKLYEKHRLCYQLTIDSKILKNQTIISNPVKYCTEKDSHSTQVNKCLSRYEVEECEKMCGKILSGEIEDYCDKTLKVGLREIDFLGKKCINIVGKNSKDCDNIIAKMKKVISEKDSSFSMSKKFIDQIELNDKKINNLIEEIKRLKRENEKLGKAVAKINKGSEKYNKQLEKLKRVYSDLQCVQFKKTIPKDNSDFSNLKSFGVKTIDGSTAIRASSAAKANIKIQRKDSGQARSLQRMKPME